MWRGGAWPDRTLDVHFTRQGWADCRHWVETDRVVLGRVTQLFKDTRRLSFVRIGKPESLKEGGWRGGGLGDCA